MKLQYKLGGATVKLNTLSFGDLFSYPEGDSVFILTDGNIDSKVEVVDIETGIRYKYNCDADVIKLKGKIEVSPNSG